LFGFRNEIAHGKSIKIVEKKVVPLGKEDECMRGFAKTEWESFCTRQNAERVCVANVIDVKFANSEQLI
jgi:hypothetical protein